jgi:hypothetical protein
MEPSQIQRSLFEDSSRQIFCGSSRIGNRQQRSCYFDLVRYFFLKLSKIDILEKLRFLARSFSASCVLTCPVRIEAEQ